MNIIWHGQSCFEIVATPAKNSQVKIIIDPFSEEAGLKVPKLEADILLLTHNHQSRNSVSAVSGNPFLISDPGEYEIKNIFNNNKCDKSYYKGKIFKLYLHICRFKCLIKMILNPH